MNYIPIILSLIVGLFSTIFIIPYFQKFFTNIEIAGIDQQKKNKPKIPSAGGIPVAIGFFLAMMTFVWANTFILKNRIDLDLLLAATLSCFTIAMIGFFDDIYVRRIKKMNSSNALEYRVGLKQWMKPLLTLLGAVPLMAVEAGRTIVSIPLIGTVQVGIIYPLFLVPLAVIFVSNATNMLAGYNGLEAGMTLIALLGITFWSFIRGNPIGGYVGLIGMSVIFAFYLYNKYPAKILPGDSFTYFAGALIVTSTILGGVEKFAAIAFLPWIIEFFLKLNGKFSVRSYGNLREDGTIQAPYDKIYSLPHAIIFLFEKFGIRLKENEITNILIFIEILMLIVAGLFTFINI